MSKLATNSLNQATEQMRLGLAGWRLRAFTFWNARTAQERRFLSVGAVLAALLLFYAIFIGPALDGRAALRKSLPELRQQAAEMQALALQAGRVAQQTVLQVPPMTRDSLATSLAARGLNPASLSLTGEYAKLQLNGAQFAGLVNWLDALRRENRIAVQDASIVAQDTPGLVDATITLHQRASPQQ